MENKRIKIDGIVRKILAFIAIICALVIVWVTFFILKTGLRPFFNQHHVSLIEFLTSTIYFKSPNHYGIGFVVLNTIYIVLLALVIAIPTSVFSALFIVRIAPKRISELLNSVIELLAAIPSVIYGLFGMGVITVGVKKIATAFGVQSAGGLSNLSCVLVLALMIIPTITMLSMTAIKSVDEKMVLGSLALGASRTQTHFKVVLKSAKSGIFAGIILGVGRALGEATAVSMVAGNSGSGPNLGLFETTRTLTSSMLLGLKETTGLDYDIRFSIGIVLILLILGMNILLNMVKDRIGKQHD